MSERIVCAVDRNIVICEGTRQRHIASNFITQYCANHEQIVRRNAWKAEGFGARFRMEVPQMGVEQASSILENARITGIAPAGTDEILFSVAVGDSSGLFRRTIVESASKNEGHILHDRDILIQDITVSSDGRMAFSIRTNTGEQNIAVAAKGSPQYRELTEGDSLDRNPSWNPLNQDQLFYDSAPVAYQNNGYPVVGPRSIMSIGIKNGDLEELIGDNRYDYMNPIGDAAGGIWCIRRPYQIKRQALFTPLDLLLMPYKLGHAIFRAIESFTYRNTGDTLITSGANPSKIRPVPKRTIFEGSQLDAMKNMKKNSRAGDSFPGYIPRNWELVKLDKDKQFSVLARGVCCFALGQGHTFYYSNGRYILKSDGNVATKVLEADLPTRIALL